MSLFYKQLFSISLKEIKCEQRGFDVVSQNAKNHIEKIGETFVFGYHAALINQQNDFLQQQLDTIELKYRGFAYEGAAMALALLDLLTPWKTNRLQNFLKGSADAHTYIINVGAGWAMARVPWGMRYFKKLDPLLGWLAIDGYGFHQGYFNWPKYIKQQQIPAFSADKRRIFDQGLGRSLWFVKGAQVELIVAEIASFDPVRQSDLWSGLGLAAAYAGGVDDADLTYLKKAAKQHFPHFCQGITFAVKTRLRAGNMVVHTETACRIICEMSVEKAAKLTEDALIDLPGDGEISNYEVWRQRIQQNFVI